MRKRVLLGAIVLLTLWPLFHMYLVKRYDISPWKLAGWGMYASPWRTPGVRIEALHQGRWIEADLRNPPLELARLLVDFSNSRAALGKLCPPDRIAEAYWVEQPRLDRMKITVLEAVLEPRSGMIVKRETPYDYARPTP